MKRILACLGVSIAVLGVPAHAEEAIDYATLAQLPWGGRIGDYQFIYGDELKTLLADKIVIRDRDKPNPRPSRHVGDAYCADGRYRGIGGIGVDPPIFQSYRVGLYEICVDRGAASFCWWLLSYAPGRYLQVPSDLDGPVIYIVLNDGSQYCRKEE